MWNVLRSPAGELLPCWAAAIAFWRQSPPQAAAAAAKSNEALAQLAPDVQWVESYVAADKTFCVYLAKDEIHKHAEISGFPATKITLVRKMIDPTTEKNP